MYREETRAEFAKRHALPETIEEARTKLYDAVFAGTGYEGMCVYDTGQAKRLADVIERMIDLKAAEALWSL